MRRQKTIRGRFPRERKLTLPVIKAIAKMRFAERARLLGPHHSKKGRQEGRRSGTTPCRAAQTWHRFRRDQSEALALGVRRPGIRARHPADHDLTRNAARSSGDSSLARIQLGLANNRRGDHPPTGIAWSRDTGRRRRLCKRLGSRTGRNRWLPDPGYTGSNAS